MLTIDKLNIKVKENYIVKDLSLEFSLGKNYCILWKNGSGKSSLAQTIMWNPNYDVIWWDIFLNWESILFFTSHERAKKWIFLAFQHIPEIVGIKLFEFLRTIYSEKIGQQVNFLQFKKIIVPLMEEVWLDKEFLWRDLNVGFSGGERRKLEVLQIRLLEPKYIILDEVDSWLDVDAFRSVAGLLKWLDTVDNCFIVITHLFTILDYLSVDKVWIMDKWIITDEWNLSLAQKVKERWFSS